MSKHYTTLLMAVGLAFVFGGTARADGDGGDNSMSQWTGESYAAFQRDRVGDFHTDPSELAGADEPLDKTTENKDTRLAGSSGISAMSGHPGAAFRDDTAA